MPFNDGGSSLASDRAETSLKALAAPKSWPSLINVGVEEVSNSPLTPLVDVECRARRVAIPIVIEYSNHGQTMAAGYVLHQTRNLVRADGT